MRRFIVLFALVAACKGDDKKDDKKAPAPAPDMTKPPPACLALLAAHAKMIECEPSPEGKELGKKTLETLPMMWKDVSPESYPMVARGCALQLDSIAKAVPPDECKIDVPADVQALITAETTRRTVVPPTGDAEVDKVLSDMARLRDEACACKDRACAAAAGKAFDELSFTTVSKAPLATRDQAALIVEELSACSSDMRTY